MARKKARQLFIPALVGAVLLLVRAADSPEDRLWRFRNLGKAFYENPATQEQAVEEFRKALEAAPNSARERVNYGLALLRAGKTDQGAAELEKAQKQDPAIPHTWFNLGVVYKRRGDYQRAIEQFRRMTELVPTEGVAWYNLGVLYKLLRQTDTAVKYFETTERINPDLAAPHFQLYNAYRVSGRAGDASRELATFQQLKKKQEGSVTPEDMEWCYYSEIYETIEPRPAADAPGPEVRFTDQRLPGRADPATAGLAVLDTFASGRPDLLAWSGDGVRLYRSGAELVLNSGLDDLKGVTSIAPGDYNNDGLPDLCVLTGSSAVLYINRKGRFERQAEVAKGRFEKAVWLDYDHDYDLDLVLLGEKSVLVRNQASGTFSERPFPFAAGHALDGAAFRVVADSKGLDLLVTYADRPAILYRDRLMGRYEAVPLDAVPAGSRALVPYDIDNDGEIDVAFRSPSGVAFLMNRRGKFEAAAAGQGSGGLAFADLENRGFGDLIAGGAVCRNLGLGRTAPARTPPGFVHSVAIAAADFDQDGRTDLAAIAAGGSIHVLHNATETKARALRIALAGIRNEKLAPNAEIEVKSGALYQKRIYTGVPLLFGLRGNAEAEAVRITWPNGLIQSETHAAAGRPILYKEAQRLSGSCPMIFTWNGRRFEFLTDVLGVAPLGASAGDGRYFPVDHDEYVQAPGEALGERGGRYDIRITEELREVSYLDEIELIALDHPASVEIFTNDKFKSPPFPEFRLFGVERRIYPTAARDDAGRDVLPRLLRRDRAYVDTFGRDYNGIARLHSLELDFPSNGTAPSRSRLCGRLQACGGAVLILNGWVDWADGSTFAAAAQGGPGLVMPYLQVKDASGRWRTVVNDMGIPAGKPKTIAVDLTGQFLSASRAVRIVTSLCVYWDEIFLAESSAPPPTRLTQVPLADAALGFRGFSRARIHPQRLQPESFDYAEVSAVSMWNPTPGMYTRYGDVRPLLAAADDRYVIMGSGDELRLSFDAAGLPPLPQGWKRDFLLKVDGWAKDGDANTAFPDSVGPLPFHAMSRYPYPDREHFPDDPAHRAWRAEYNTRPALRLLRRLAD